MKQTKIKTMRLLDLKQAEYNPRKQLLPDDYEYQALKKSIEEHGYLQPIIFNERTGNVVGGNQRLKVMLDMGVTEAECMVVDMDLAEEKAANIALNKISGKWDMEKLSDVLNEISSEVDITSIGFNEAEIEALVSNEKINLDDWYTEEPVMNEVKKKTVKCPNCGCDIEV